MTATAEMMIEERAGLFMEHGMPCKARLPAGLREEKTDRPA